MELHNVQGPESGALLRAKAAAPGPHARAPDKPETVRPAARDHVSPSEEQVQKTAPDTQPTVRIDAAHPRIKIDEQSQRVITQLVDENDEVIRQIPPEELLRVADQLRRLRGVLFDEQA